ncbi:MAG: hypothetical protein IH989_02675 [Planctomycetes bacterium]|nr:hypothetical protein [Planctomycetota bacterium]
MKADAATSPDARCLSCGYLLRGLPEPVCPECARAFDPADPSTFDADPRKHRRRRLLIRIAAGLAIAALAAGLFPRGILKADVKFTCSRCNRLVTVTRWQLNPPSWISFPYPGINSREDSDAGIDTPTKRSCDHRYKFAIRSDLPIGGRVTGGGSLEPGELTTVNDVPLSLDTAPHVLRALLKPGNNGISVGP